MDHGAMDHGAMDHGAMPSLTPPATPESEPDGAQTAQLSGVLGAYLALHDALASDRTDPAAAGRLAAALAREAQTAPPGDPHRWHRLAAPLAQAQAASDALRQTDDLDRARQLFGRLSVSVAALVDAADAGHGLERHTCGMADAPEGGVWLQRAGAVRNPYYGTAMLLCSRRSVSLPSSQ